MWEPARPIRARCAKKSPSRQNTSQDHYYVAAAYLLAQQHLYTRTLRGEPRQDLFKAGLKTVDLVSQVRSSADYTLTDLDHYYEFFGGLSRSVEAVRGKKPEMLVTDSASRDLYTDEAGKAIEIGVQTRLLNPEYINEMLSHNDLHGNGGIYRTVHHSKGPADRPDYEIDKNMHLFRTPSHPDGQKQTPEFVITD